MNYDDIELVRPHDLFDEWKNVEAVKLAETYGEHATVIIDFLNKLERLRSPYGLTSDHANEKRENRTNEFVKWLKHEHCIEKNYLRKDMLSQKIRRFQIS